MKTERAQIGYTAVASAVAPLRDATYDSDVAFRRAVVDAVGPTVYEEHRSELVSAAISMNPTLILAGILGFVASFAISLGPVMWVLFSELFPNRVRGLAIVIRLVPETKGRSLEELQAELVRT